MTLDLTELFRKQGELDAHIQRQHQVTYASTREKRLLALLVEIGEMINETKTFKFWSKKPGAEPAIILDEYADGLHFFLSLGLEVKSEKKQYAIQSFSGNLTQATLLVFQQVSTLIRDWSVSQFELAFQHYLNLIPLLGFTTEAVTAGYFKKLDVNYTRQKNHY